MTDIHGRVGRLIVNRFKGKRIEILSSIDSETLLLDQFSTNNRFIISGVVQEYHEESGILELKDGEGTSFYMNEWYIIIFWEPGFDYTNCMSNMIKTGKAAFNKKNRDIM